MAGSSDADSSGVCGGDDASTEEVEAGAALHGSLDQLEAVNNFFDRTIAPVVLESGANSSFISGEMFGKGCMRAM